MPADQAQYIHRVGRTARAGKQGQAILLLHDFEHFFLRSIQELPVEKMKPSTVQVNPPACICVHHMGTGTSLWLVLVTRQNPPKPTMLFVSALAASPGLTSSLSGSIGSTSPQNTASECVGRPQPNSYAHLMLTSYLFVCPNGHTQKTVHMMVLQ